MPGDSEAALDQGPMDATGERFQDRHTADEPEVSRCICSSLTIWCTSRTSFCLYDLGFQSLRQREFVSLALLGEWKSAEPGERVVTEGESVPNLRSFMDKRPDLRVTLQHLVNRDLAGKLEKLLSP